MLTFLSRSIVALVHLLAGRRSPPALAGGARVLLLPAACTSETPAESASGQVLPARPRLALIQGTKSASAKRDTPIAVALSVGATPFVAGQGARLYSLDVFRRERGGPPNPRRPRAAS